MTDFSNRDPAQGVDPLFYQRWSPRSFIKQGLALDTMDRIVDAARWSPSCFNAQPWRIYTSDESTFEAFLGLLVEANQTWAKEAELLGFFVAKRQFEHNGQPNDYAEFDCGAAWMALTLQAQREGLYTHGLGGIYRDQVAHYLGLDESKYKVVMGFALGHINHNGVLPAELAELEVPSPRKKLSEIWPTR